MLGISAAALIMIITIYSYGVYNGSKLRRQSPAIEMPISSAYQVSNANQNALLLESVEKMMQVSVPVPTENVAPKILSPKPNDFYTIQLIAYRQEAQAKMASQKLVNQGFRPIIILRSTNLFKVCTGQFETQEQANTELQKIRGQADSYKDAFIRFVKAKNQNAANSNIT